MNNDEATVKSFSKMIGGKNEIVIKSREESEKMDSQYCKKLNLKAVNENTKLKVDKEIEKTWKATQK